MTGPKENSELCFPETSTLGVEEKICEKMICLTVPARSTSGSQTEQKKKETISQCHITSPC